MKINRNGVKRFFGGMIKTTIAVTVLLFLGLKSLDFFTFTTPADQWYYAYLGLGLTGGGVIAYLLIFLWDADSDLKRTVAIVMLGICVIGELATAGFGLRVNAWMKQGYQMDQSNFDSMVLVVQLLGFAHAIALIAYVAGDKLIEAFSDEDGDGIPNIVDKDYRKNKPQFRRPEFQLQNHDVKRQELKPEHNEPDPTNAGKPND